MAPRCMGASHFRQVPPTAPASTLWFSLPLGRRRSLGSMYTTCEKHTSLLLNDQSQVPVAPEGTDDDTLMCKHLLVAHVFADPCHIDARRLHSSTARTSATGTACRQ